jgi:hypothetical protein
MCPYRRDSKPNIHYGSVVIPLMKIHIFPNGFLELRIGDFAQIYPQFIAHCSNVWTGMGTHHNKAIRRAAVKRWRHVLATTAPPNSRLIPTVELAPPAPLLTEPNDFALKPTDKNSLGEQGWPPEYCAIAAREPSNLLRVERQFLGVVAEVSVCSRCRHWETHHQPLALRQGTALSPQQQPEATNFWGNIESALPARLAGPKTGSPNQALRLREKEPGRHRAS